MRAVSGGSQVSLTTRCSAVERGRTCHRDGVLSVVTCSNRQPIWISTLTSVIHPREQVTSGRCRLCEQVTQNQNRFGFWCAPKDSPADSDHPAHSGFVQTRS